MIHNKATLPLQFNNGGKLAHSMPTIRHVTIFRLPLKQPLPVLSSGELKRQHEM